MSVKNSSVLEVCGSTIVRDKPYKVRNQIKGSHEKILLIIGMLYLILPLQAQTGIPKAQAMFIYNFSRLVEWPVAYKSGPFVIGVLGGSSVADELEVYAMGKKSRHAGNTDQKV